MLTKTTKLHQMVGELQSKYSDSRATKYLSLTDMSIGKCLDHQKKLHTHTHPDCCVLQLLDALWILLQGRDGPRDRVQDNGRRIRQIGEAEDQG